MLVQKLSLTQNLSGTNAITVLLSYIYLTSPHLFIQPQSSRHTRCPKSNYHHPSSSGTVLHLTQPNRSFCRKRKTVSRKAPNLFLKSPLSFSSYPHSSGYPLATSGPLYDPRHSFLVSSCSCRHPTTSRIRQSTYEPRASHVF